MAEAKWSKKRKFMRLFWVFLRNHKERVKILRKRRQDHLGLGGDGEGDEEVKLKKKNGGLGFGALAETLWG